MLYLVGTPIGNLSDMSPRAEEVLTQADVIACEDTRVTGILLKEKGIEAKKLFCYQEHNKAAKGPVLIDMMKQGLTVAQVSDAGMPAISDPGEDLVRLAVEAGIEVSVIPGPVAAVSALAISGLSTRYYHFEGFLPQESKKRRDRLEALKAYGETIVLYEAPHRIQKLIEELEDAGFGDKKASFCRELTKKYEEVIRLTVSEAKEYFEQNAPRGEFVVCLEPLASSSGPKGESAGTCDADTLIKLLLDKGMPTKDIAQVVSKATGLGKKEMYARTLELS
ncbi:MAG: 16S rRNA (cytidine(1402)-2'-O)-methyltransferase [Clostridiales bacterium]|nr:16S rRNA (cytidine(1402)-2'-O)-methyltransferase [Clostridiales bacterium]